MVRSRGTRISKQRDSDASERRPAGGSPPSSSPDVLSERWGTGVSSFQTTTPLLDVFSLFTNVPIDDAINISLINFIIPTNYHLLLIKSVVKSYWN